MKKKLFMRRFVIGDIHGGYLAIKELLQIIDFNYENDLLISLGDLVDGWSQSKEVFDLMLSIKNKVIVRGNHDEMALYYYKRLTHPRFDDYFSIWKGNDAQSTLDSLGTLETIKPKYVTLLENTLEYYILDDNLLFVHAGVPEAAVKTNNLGSPFFPLEKVDSYNFIWNRSLAKDVYFNRNNPSYKLGNIYKQIYIGHTRVQKLDENQTTPLTVGNITLMDTGAGQKGKLSIMNIDTKEVFQSQEVRTYYPFDKGRNEFSYYEEMNK